MFAKAYTWADFYYPVATPSSMFKIASCSKPITSIAIGRLLERGVLSKADLLVSKVTLQPPQGAALPTGFSQITIEELRTHRSGLEPNWPDNATIAAAYGHPTPISIFEEISYASAHSVFAPGFPSSTNLNVKYQNLNYALLALVVRGVSLGLYTDYVRAQIFGPLGLATPHVGASLHSQRPPLEVQHHSSCPSSVGINVVATSPALVGSGYGTNVQENYEGYEDWVISTVDYAAILAAIGTGNLAKSPILTQASMVDMFAKIDPTGQTDDFTQGGLFWGNSPGGVTVFGHNGGWSVGGANCASWVLSRSDGVSVALFMNMDDSGPLGTFAYGSGGTNANGQLQNILDGIKTWPAKGDLFSAFGIPPLA